MKPWHILVFLISVFMLLALIGAVLPKEGLSLGEGHALRFPSAQHVLFPTEQELVDISDILAVPTDSMSVPDTAAQRASAEDTITAPPPFVFDASKLPPLEQRIALHYPEGNKTVLYPLFAALEGSRSRKKPVRVLHYGDSQIEGDRITSYLRNKLQTQFGGSGPGLFAVADIVPSFSVERTLSENWRRYSAMGRKDPSMHHDRFGALSAFSRFTPILPDSVPVDTVEHEATITLRPEKRAYAKAREFQVCKLFFGWHRAPLMLQIASNGEVISSEVIPASDHHLVREWRFDDVFAEVVITMKGADSPDVFGVSLESRQGVCMDNIAARGSAGYEFRRMDQGLLQRMYNELDVALLILQYGGNILPNLKSADEAIQYGRFLGAQIARFKKLIPGVCVIVIGPSDMSIKDGDVFMTRPLLEEVNDAMRINTLAQGAVFWDMYSAMGGRNSMVSWVEADPPLAATDYTHFSPQGARKVGELFWTALVNDFALYHASRK